MITKSCKRCGQEAKPSFHIEAHEAHLLHKGHELLKGTSWVRSHPYLAGAAFVAGGIWRAVDSFHWKCGHCGHSFK